MCDDEINMLENQIKPKDTKDNAGYIYNKSITQKQDSVYKIGRMKYLNKRLVLFNW